MTGYIFRRFLQSVIVLLLVTMIMFIMFHLLPGNPARAELGVKAQPATIAAFDKLQGLNKPVWYQFWLYLDHLAHGNLGFSYVQNSTVAQLFVEYFPKSIILVGCATIVAIGIAVPLGVMQAVRRNRVEDYVFTGASFVFYSFPTFWLGLILIEIFSINLHLVPAEVPAGTSVAQILAHWKELILPVMTLAMISIASYSRYMRSAMIDSLAQDYIRTAKAKGVSQKAVLLRHALRNSLIPMATLIGLSIPGVLSGAVITESVFNYPGVGLLFVQSALSNDFSVLLGLTLVAAVGVVVGNLVADIAYAVLDPRIRY
ncbi:MAG TPA: ABC transporter permease [Acidimicrobiales bacterium]|nr:ABC transporter permease [Acidimicrobiales bacterium]